MKTCSRCKEEKPFSEFSKKRGRAYGLASHCKLCTRVKDKKYTSRPDIKSRRAILQKGYAEKQGKEGYWDKKLRHYYNITYVQYLVILDGQAGGCFLCGNPPNTGRRLSVDHDHACCSGKKSCGKCIRGLLCDVCNRFVLGKIENVPDYLDRVAEYLGTRPMF